MKKKVKRKKLTKAEKEMEILKAQAMNEGKPAEIAEKMVQGRIGKFYSEICLVDQAFVKNPDEKVGKMVESKGAKIVRFARIREIISWHKQLH